MVLALSILIFSIAMGADQEFIRDNSFYVKSIATYAPTFFEYLISVCVSSGSAGPDTIDDKCKENKFNRINN